MISLTACLNLITGFYDYESAFIKIWQDLGREALEKQPQHASQRQAKNITAFGYVTINNTCPFSKGNNGFQISPRFQEHKVYAVQSGCYENCNEVLAQFVNTKQ